MIKKSCGIDLKFLWSLQKSYDIQLIQFIFFQGNEIY
jgi:hypothetical protein